MGCSTAVRTHRSVAVLGLLVFVLGAVPACRFLSSPTLGDAVVAFDTAVQTEAQLEFRRDRHFDSYQLEIVAPLVARSHYQSALQKADAVTSTSGDYIKLKPGESDVRDARILECLCLWRLGRHDDAITVYKDARARDRLIEDDAEKNDLTPRDRAILRSIRGLIHLDKLDRTVSDYRRDQGELGLEDIRTRAWGACEAFQGAGDSLPTHHEFRSFLIQGELSARMGFLAAYRHAQSKGRPVTEFDGFATDSLEAADVLLVKLGRLVPSTREGSALVEHWRLTMSRYRRRPTSRAEK